MWTIAVWGDEQELARAKEQIASFDPSAEFSPAEGIYFIQEGDEESFARNHHLQIGTPHFSVNTNIHLLKLEQLVSAQVEMSF